MCVCVCVSRKIFGCLKSKFKYHDYLFFSDATPSKFKLAGDVATRGHSTGALKDMTMAKKKTMIIKLANRKMANGLAFCSHVQEMRAKGSTAPGLVHQSSATVLRSFRRGLPEELADAHQPHAR